METRLRRWRFRQDWGEGRWEEGEEAGDGTDGSGVLHQKLPTSLMPSQMLLTALLSQPGSSGARLSVASESAFAMSRA